MLRSVVSAMAANMMLVQCNSDVPISLACSTASASVRTTASPEPRPWGTSRACNQADIRLELRASGRMGHLSVSSEVGVIDPHPVQDHRDASGQGDHGPLGPAASGELCAPCSQPRCPPAMHHDGCRLAQRASKVDVTRLGDPPETSRSPDWLREGVRPTQGPTFFDEVNRAGSSTADR